MKKLLFAIAICGFVLTSCGDKTKKTANEEKACCPHSKTEVVAEKEEGCKSGCSHSCTKEEKTECTKSTEKTNDATATSEAKTESSKKCCSKS